jgi:WD40 repeat protein
LLLLQAACHGKPGTCLAFSPDGQLLASGAADGSLVCQPSSLAEAAIISSSDGSSGGQRHPPLHAPAAVGGGGGVSAVAFDAAGKVMVSGGRDGSLLVHQVSGECSISWQSTVCASYPRCNLCIDIPCCMLVLIPCSPGHPLPL